jgi:hypothetical protein
MLLRDTTLLAVVSDHGTEDAALIEFVGKEPYLFFIAVVKPNFKRSVMGVISKHSIFDAGQGLKRQKGR